MFWKPGMCKWNVGLLVEGKNMFENNTKCRVNATYRPTNIVIYHNRTGVYTIIIIGLNIDIYNRTGVYTIVIIRLNIARGSNYNRTGVYTIIIIRLNIATSSDHRGPSRMCKLPQVAKGWMIWPLQQVKEDHFNFVVACCSHFLCFETGWIASLCHSVWTYTIWLRLVSHLGFYWLRKFDWPLAVILSSERSVDMSIPNMVLTL